MIASYINPFKKRENYLIQPQYCPSKNNYYSGKVKTITEESNEETQSSIFSKNQEEEKALRLQQASRGVSNIVSKYQTAINLSSEDNLTNENFKCKESLNSKMSVADEASASGNFR